MTWYRLFLAILCPYLIGSIPFGYFVIRWMKGKDIRTIGSGRTGGTNAIRAGGSGAGILTGASDILKGVLALMLAWAIAGKTPLTDVLAGIAVVVGHNWSVFMGFRGGAGTTPNIGASIAIWPVSAIWLLPMLPFGLNVIRYASLTSLAIAAMIPIGLAVRATLGLGPWLDVLYGGLTALTVVWALRPNIKRLINGTEPRAPKLLSQ